MAHREMHKGFGTKERAQSRGRRKEEIHHATGRVVNALHPERRTQQSEFGFPTPPAFRWVN